MKVMKNFVQNVILCVVLLQRHISKLYLMATLLCKPVQLLIHANI